MFTKVLSWIAAFVMSVVFCSMVDVMACGWDKSTPLVGLALASIAWMAVTIWAIGISAAAKVMHTYCGKLMDKSFIFIATALLLCLLAWPVVLVVFVVAWTLCTMFDFIGTIVDALIPA